MKGKEYFNRFTKDEKVVWLKNFHKIGFDDFKSSEQVMKTEFKNYFQFFFGIFPIEKTKEGYDYWTNLFQKYREYDKLTIKTGYNFNSFITKQKVF